MTRRMCLVAGVAVALVLAGLVVTLMRPNSHRASPAASPPADPPPPCPEFSIDYGGQMVLRRSPSGRLLWATALKGVGLDSRGPDLAWGGGGVYAAQGDGVTALDARTGKVLWRSKGPRQRLLLDGRLLLAAECGSGEACESTGRWLVARSTADGQVAFRVRLPSKDFDPSRIRRVADLYLVQAVARISELPDGVALLFDQGGKVWHRLDREVLDGRRRGNDVVLLTPGDVVRLGPGGEQRWAARFEECDGLPVGGMVDLEGGGVLAFVYGCINDSGVEVVRLDPATGDVAWRARCAPLGVNHSKYFHEAKLVVEGASVRVTSKGSYGWFVEVLDLKSGVRLDRKSDSRD